MWLTRAPTELTVATFEDADAIATPLSEAGFPRADGHWYDAPQDGAEPGRWDKRFHFGADPARPANLHVRVEGGPAWRLALLFRDWLGANPDEREAYTELKRSLARAHGADGSVEPYALEKQTWVNAAFERAENWAAEVSWSP